MIPIDTTRRIGDVRKALRGAAKAGGAYRVEVYMSPTSASTAAALLHMARGASRRDLEHWQHDVSSTRSRAYRNGCNGRGSMSLRYLASADNREARGPRHTFVSDPAYEARMLAWAQQFAYCGADRAALAA